MEKEQDQKQQNNKNLSDEEMNTINQKKEKILNNESEIKDNESEIKDNESEIKDNESEIKEEEKELSPSEKILQLEDKLTRTFAEMENQRRRFEKEKEDAFDYGNFSFAKEALNIIDNLERSKKILEVDESLKDSAALKKTLEHLDIINKDLISIFSKNNIKVIECLNQKLNPNFHQAMMEIGDNEKEPGTIVQEIQKGFTIKDRLLRPSLVGVSKKIDNKVKENEENEENKDNINNK
jgi:molecular chaperone GrpE